MKNTDDEKMMIRKKKEKKKLRILDFGKIFILLSHQYRGLLFLHDIDFIHRIFGMTIYTAKIFIMLIKSNKYYISEYFDRF